MLNGHQSPRNSSSSSMKGNYWSTMRALSNDDNRRFGPFSTGSNGAAAHTDTREGDICDPLSSSEGNNSDNEQQWAAKEIKVEQKCNIDNESVLQNAATKTINDDGDKHYDNSSSLKDDDDDEEFDGESLLNENQPMSEDGELPDVKSSKLRLSTEGQTSVMGDEINQNQEAHSEDLAFDAQMPDISDDNMASQDNDTHIHAQNEDDVEDDGVDDQAEMSKAFVDPNIWTLPLDRDECTLEEIRRGQVINATAPNECPVMGCGKKINEARAEPSPGTIASGLRTHVLFVHYANRKSTKKRKALGWTKRRNQTSPKKQINQGSSPSTSIRDYDLNINTSSALNQSAGLNLMQKANSSFQMPHSGPGSLLDRKVKQIAAKSQAHQMSSLQSLMQATGGPRSSPRPSKPPKSQEVNNNPQKNFNSTTSSLFSILAGLTQQQQLNQQQSLLSKNVKSSNPMSNTVNVSQCSRNQTNNNQSANSSLLSLLNEKISGNVANSLKKTLDTQVKVPNSMPRQNVPSPASASYYQSNNSDIAYNNGSSILSNLCSGVGDNRMQSHNSLPFNSFIESIALKTGSNIGQAGILEAKKIIEKFTTSLICSAQTIADHYIAPFGGEVPQQKPEISPSDVLLAYKMMHKSHGQP